MIIIKFPHAYLQQQIRNCLAILKQIPAFFQKKPCLLKTTNPMWLQILQNRPAIWYQTSISKLNNQIFLCLHKRKIKKHSPADGIIGGGWGKELNSSHAISCKSDFILLKLLCETTYRKTRKPLIHRLQAP